MYGRRLTIALLAPPLLGGVLGCGGDETTPPPDEQPACEAPAVALPDGSCLRPGIAPDGCAEGFVHDGEYGCEAILPPEPCPRGLMAVPGETECRPVLSCGEGRWGDIPVDDATLYVDGAYGGGDSDGSAARPFTTINEAVAAAVPSSLIAVAEGHYEEDVVVQGKPVRLWGRCPEKVEVLGTDSGIAAIVIRELASGSEVRGLAIGGGARGVGVSDAKDVTLEQLWVRDCAEFGIDVNDTLGPASARISNSLVEHNHHAGLLVVGADATVEGTVVRATMPQASDQRFGNGIVVQLACDQGLCDPTRRSTATIRGSLVEQNHHVGLLVAGSDVTVEGTVVRATLPQASDQTSGQGITVQPSCVQGVCDPATRSTATIRGSLVEQNQEVGLFVGGSDITVEGTVVRTTSPRASDMMVGRGINIEIACSPQGLCDPAMRSTATIRGVLVEQNHDVGLLVSGSDATVEAAVVRATLPQASDQRSGRGINLQLSCDSHGLCDAAARASATVRGSLVEQNYDVGLLVMGSDATVEATVVRATQPAVADGFFGDGVSVVSHQGLASAALSVVLIDESARAGVASFGGMVSLHSVVVRCAAFALNGETYDGHDFDFEDGGGNACGCPQADGICKSVSAGLEPPEALAP